MSDDLPFKFTPEAADHVRSCLMNSAPHGTEPALYCMTKVQEEDQEGRVLFEFPKQSFAIGFYEQGKRPNALHFEMFGSSVSIVPHTLELIRGRTLTIERPTSAEGPAIKKEFLVIAQQGDGAEPPLSL